MSDNKAPKPPKLSASKEEHRRFAKEVDKYEPYGKEPPGGVKTDPIPDNEFGDKNND